MPKRLYISTLYGDGNRNNPWRSAFDQVFQGTGKNRRQVIDGAEKFYALTVAETNAAEHALLVADPKIRHISKALLLTKRADLTAGQTTAITEVLSHLGMGRAGAIFTDQALVLDLVQWINGSRKWDGLTILEE